MAGKKINDLTALGRDLASTDLLELSLAGGTGSRKITGQQIINAIPSGITIGTTAITSGTVGRVLFEGTGNVVQESANLFWDNTNGRLGIGTGSAPSQKLVVEFPFLGTVTNRVGFYDLDSGLATIGSRALIAMGFADPRTVGIGSITTANSGFEQALTFHTASGGTGLISNPSGSERMRIFPNGNLGINTTTDAGYKLDVNGTARVSGQATIAGTTNASAGIGRNTLINGTITATANSNVLVGLDIEPTFNTGAFTGVETLALRVTGFISNFTSSGATQLRIIGPSGSNKSLFFFNSSTTFASTRIYNQGTTNHLIFATGDSLSNPTDRFTIFASTGNVGINTTTDAGFKLDVNGTARVTGRIDAGTFTAGAGASAYTIATTGRISAGNGITFRSPTVGDSDFTGFVGGGIGIQVFQNNATMFSFGGAGNLTSTIALATPNFAPSSGTGTKNIFEVGGTYNTTGTFTGTIRGFYYNPTLTSLVGTTHYAFHSTSGAVVINSGSPNASAILQADSTTQGFLPPRMTTTQVNAISLPAEGLVVYNTTISHLCVYQAGAWVKMNHSPM